MLPALVLFRPLWTEPARARCISSLRYPNAFWPECYRVPCFFYALAGRGFTPTKTEENVPPHPFPELPEGPKSPLYFTALAQYGPDVPAVRFRAAGRPFLGRGTGERPHAARSGAAGVNKTLSVTSTIPHSGCSRQALRRKRSLKSGSRGGLRIEFFIE